MAARANNYLIMSVWFKCFISNFNPCPPEISNLRDNVSIHLPKAEDYTIQLVISVHAFVPIKSEGYEIVENLSE